MSIVPWNPWKEMEELRAQTDRLWDKYLAKLTDDYEGTVEMGFLPEVDLVETAYDFRVFVAVPGLVEDDIDIEATSLSLTVRGERHAPYDPQRRHVREWRYGYFERQLNLRASIVVEDIQISYDAGVLTVILPKQKPTSDKG